MGKNTVSNPTGIEEMKNEKSRVNNEEAYIYNLSGQRLNKMQKGINIMVGRKIAVK